MNLTGILRMNSDNAFTSFSQVSGTYNKFFIKVSFATAIIIISNLKTTQRQRLA